MEIILFLQNLGDWLVPVAKFFTFLGLEEFYLLIMPAMYWCIDSLIGARLAIMLFITASLNGILKLAFHSPRPYWVSTKIKAGSADPYFGIPSGHAQNAFALWGTWAGSLRKTWIWVIAGFFILMIGLSRLVLGMHFSTDVVLGWIFGGLLLLAFFALENRVQNWFKSQTILGQIITVILIALLISLIGNLMIAVQSNFELPTEWMENGTLAGATPHPFSRDIFSTTSGGLLGMGLGLILMKQWGGFNPKGKLWKRVARYILGMAGTLALYAGLKAIFPSGQEFLPQALRIVRYASIAFWVAAGAPMVFIRLNLIEPATSE